MKIDAELEDLNEALLQMSSQVLENLKKALDYYFNQSVCEVNDDEIDQFERKIESECVKILLHERPYARDLKEVTGILKLVEDIERIGDHAEDIVTFSKKLNGYGFRVQKSAFEAMITESLYRKLIDEIPAMIDKEIDSVRVYKIRGSGEVNLFGISNTITDEEVIIL